MGIKNLFLEGTGEGPISINLAQTSEGSSAGGSPIRGVPLLLILSNILECSSTATVQGIRVIFMTGVVIICVDLGGCSLGGVALHGQRRRRTGDELD
ncbi:hypothetical protein CRG98_015660 [Punica granatum]|uniref:Uncharacterized protein n=1 Tax=Punica granatum TaxID=22663 RepID=A0A2I0K610_PUNGR|nr:hypothetical protein CRG98_015660 [Punica granatum]